jgi:type I restriction enzyme S subunit
MSKRKQAKQTAMVPRLRFPEFRKAVAWKEEKLEELIDTVSPPAKLPSSSYLATGKFPIIDQSQDAICGWTDDAQVLVKEPLPLIVFGDHTCALKFVDRPFAQGADGIKILAARPTISIEYLFHSLNHQPLVMEDYKRHFSVLKERRVFFPSVESGEQQKIADCLTSLDDVIAAQGRKVGALKTHKHGLMQQLFPREGETRPYLRFPEFRNAAEWEQKLGGALFENRKEGGEEGLPIYSVTVNDGMIPRASFDRDFYDIEDPAKNKKACKGDIAYNMMRMWQGAQGVAVENCMVSPAYVVLSPFEGVCSSFFAYLFKLAQSLELLTAYSRGLTKDRLRLYFEDFARMPLCVPRYAEQQRIADCLSSLDAQITAESHRLAAFKTHKQSLMQQLFPLPEGASA